jgi:uncharacterized protein
LIINSGKSWEEKGQIMNPLYKNNYQQKKNKFSDRRCILFFVRVPERGKVKTRLGNVIGHDASLQLYLSFVADELDMLRDLFFDVFICFHPHSGKHMVENWLKDEFHLIAQEGKDLGQRMGNAFEEIFSRGYELALLVGSDIPNLPSLIILDAFHHLTTQDSVIGPSEDGGYYLIGFRHDTFCKEAFMQIPWGTSEVYEQTLHFFHNKNIDYYALVPLRDIDDYEDLVWLKKSLEDNPDVAQHTRLSLMKLI